MSIQHFRTMLRREAVVRLRMDGKSFRKIGRELGISQVAAWKLWHQVVGDEIEKVFAERGGRQLLQEAFDLDQSGTSLELSNLRQLVIARFGSRVAARFFGGPHRIKC
ncbi:MAG: hypothetical protein EOP83_02015 [Verrucomicrobiaceae bacterium]|nr:MAG: hypothetical protein EOP83_02015 [Verrucomicrobiaceae bacterium]